MSPQLNITGWVKMRNGCATERMRNGTDAERMGLKYGTERNGYGVEMRNGTDMWLK